MFWLLCLLIALPLAAQTNRDGMQRENAISGGNAVFAPFVSMIQVELRNNLLRLSWVDSPDVRGPVYIYRSNMPFNGAMPLSGSFSGIRPLEVPYGTRSFVDDIEDGGTTGEYLHYFIAASDERGRSYDISIAFTNTISIRLPETDHVPTIHPIVPVYTPEPAPQRGIFSLEAVPQADRIIITFTKGQDLAARTAGPENLNLYRSLRPIRQTADLLGAVIVQTGVSSPFRDLAVPGIPYFYAVIAEDDLVRGTVEIVPGRNATITPAELQAASSQEHGGQDFRTIRAMPLPNISVQTAIPGIISHTAAPPPSELSTEAAKALGNIRPQNEHILKRPRVFARDMETPGAGGEEYALSAIIRGSFMARNWEAAGEELLIFLSLPRIPEVNARARFYLGQCWYFLNRPRDGLFEFLSIQDRYPNEASEWIRASLDMMTSR